MPQDDQSDAAAREPPSWLEDRLTTAELSAAASQGFVGYSRLPSGRVIAKLRFRFKGRQRVVYIGADLAEAARVAAEIQRLQTPTRRRRRLNRLCRQTGRLFRASRQQLAPVLAREGWHFHGLAIRKRRSIPSSTVNVCFLKGEKS